MKMSQHSTLHHDNKALDRGMWLYEHRRCWDEIISYCSELCYKGTLQPKQGSAYASAKIAPLFPPMAYLHIDGKSQSQGGSRINRHEAKAIADWIAANREQIQQYYQGETISKVLGIVTPFGAQKTAIKSALEEALGGDNGITVGTVHALQGAERNLIIFSPVYSRHESGGQFFFDVGPNMLNVAVSRAKHSFMVFGDMEIFDKKGNKPSSLLARHIFSSPKNEISTSITPSPSQDLR
jgi:superfamily I DNA and/or RNA helicase